jgi:hypothetical protein
MGPNFRFASRAHLRVCVQIANSRALSDAEAYSLPGRAHYPSHDFRAGLSGTTTFHDLIPVQRLFVFNGTTVCYPPRPGFPAGPARGPGPFCATQVIFRSPRSSPACPGCCGPSGGRPGPAGGRRRRLAGLSGAARAAGPGIGRLRRRHRRPDTLVCVGPRAFRPSGAGPFGGARAISSVGERSAHTGEAAGSNPASPTSQRARPAAGSGSRPPPHIW